MAPGGENTGDTILYGATEPRGPLIKTHSVDLGYAHQNYEQILFALGHKRWTPAQRLAEKLYDPGSDEEAFKWTDAQVGPFIDKLIDMESEGLVKNDVGVPGARLFTVNWQITDAGMDLSSDLLYHYYSNEATRRPA